jgi:hypothetical protein
MVWKIGGMGQGMPKFEPLAKLSSLLPGKDSRDFNPLLPVHDF